MVELATEIDQPLYLGQAHHFLSMCYEGIGQYDEALKEAQIALPYFESADKPLAVARVHNQIGIIYMMMNKPALFEKGLASMKTYLSMLDPDANQQDWARSMTNIGGVYLTMGINDSAIVYLNQSIRIYDELGVVPGQIDNYINKGLAYYIEPTKDSARYYWYNAEQLAEELNSPAQLANIYQNLIDYFIDAKRYPEAKQYLDKKVLLTRQIQSDYIRMKTLEAQSYYYENTGDFQTALSLAKEFKNLSDSLTGENITSSMANLESFYNLNLKEEQIKVLEQLDQKKKTRIIFLIVLSLAILVIAGLIIRMILKGRKQEREVARLEMDKQRLREEELEVQIEYKSKQMTSHTLNMMVKNQFLTELEAKLTEVEASCEGKPRTQIRRLKSSIQQQAQSENDWTLFKNYFEEVNTGFYDSLTRQFPGLSSNDYKLCALLKLNLNIKESANILNISPESVKTARYRLRKKLNLDQDQDLHEFIQTI